MPALFLRPDADQSDGSWLNEASSNTNLFASVDESSFSDTDFIRSSSTGGDKVRLQLSDPGAPVSAPLTIRYRCKQTGMTYVAAIGRLFQGSTQIAQWTQVPTDTFTTYTYTLTPAEFASITDFTNLFVEFEYSDSWWLFGASIDLWLSNALYYDSSAGAGQAITTYLSCSRASIGYAKTSIGTLTQFASNVLRITDLGLLVEDARTNVCIHSQTINSTNWTVGQTFESMTGTDNAAIAPDGTTTMTQLNDGVAAARHVLSTGGGSNDTFAASIFVKDLDRRYFAIVALNGSNANAIYVFVDLQTGTVTDSGAVNGTIAIASIEPYANGTYRIQLGGTVTGLSSVFFSMSNSPTGSGSNPFYPSYTGSNKSVYVWGAQIESTVSFPSSYIPTTGAAATRAADQVTAISTLDTIIDGAVGSAVADVLFNFTLAQAPAGQSIRILADAAGSTNTMLYWRTPSGQTVGSYNGAAELTASIGGSQAFETGAKVGVAWDAGPNRSVVGGGGTVSSDTGSIGNGGNIYLGFTVGGGGADTMFGYFRRLTVWNSKLSNATLQGLTV